MKKLEIFVHAKTSPNSMGNCMWLHTMQNEIPRVGEHIKPKGIQYPLKVMSVVHCYNKNQVEIGLENTFFLQEGILRKAGFRKR